jgi:hypothetical protein
MSTPIIDRVDCIALLLPHYVGATGKTRLIDMGYPYTVALRFGTRDRGGHGGHLSRTRGAGRDTHPIASIIRLVTPTPANIANIANNRKNILRPGLIVSGTRPLLAPISVVANNSRGEKNVVLQRLNPIVSGIVSVVSGTSQFPLFLVPGRRADNLKRVWCIGIRHKNGTPDYGCYLS